MRGLEGNVNVFYQGLDFMSMIGKGDNGPEKWLEMCVSAGH